MLFRWRPQDPLLHRKLAAYIQTGRPTLITDNLVVALAGTVDLTAANAHVLVVGTSPAAMLAAPQPLFRELRSALIAPLHNFTLWQAPTNFLSFHPFSDGERRQVCEHSSLQPHFATVPFGFVDTLRVC